MDAVDLPDLATMRERWRTLAIAAHACSIQDLWVSTVNSDTHADPNGSGLELLALRSQAAVLTGFDPELPDDLMFVETALLVDGAPSWVATAVAEVAPLGDAVWWDGSGWFRSTAASGLAGAVEILAVPLAGPEEMADELLTLVEADQFEDRPAALEFAVHPTPEGLIRLYGEGRRYGFEPEHAHAAFAEYTR